jgi:hypothetical protein
MGKKKGQTMSLGAFNAEMGVKPQTVVDLCNYKTQTEDEQPVAPRALTLSDNKFLKYTSYTETDGCHRYYTSAALWEERTAACDWDTIAGIFLHIVKMMEADEERHPTLRWGSHSTFPQLCRHLVSRLARLKEERRLTDKVRRAAGQFKLKADPCLTTKQADMPHWRDDSLFIYDL